MSKYQLGANQEQFDHYLIGMVTIDREHFELDVMARALEDESLSRAVMETQAHLLAEAFESHLLHEEQIMDMIKYPYATFHKERHREISLQIIDYKSRIPTASQYAIIQQTRRISDGFMHHIDNYDRAFALYLEQHENDCYKCQNGQARDGCVVEWTSVHNCLQCNKRR